MPELTPVTNFKKITQGPKRNLYIQIIPIAALTLLGMWLAACGGGGSASGGPTPTSALAATPISTHVFAQPTTIIKKETEAATAAPTADADLSRGERVYTSKGCGECHGPQGEGVAGKAEKLAGTQLTETEFADILRTGGQGSLGNAHLYGVQAISPSGMEALYAFIKSLP